MVIAPTTTVPLAGAPVLSRSSLQYVLVTPARNEASLIESTIKSILSQSNLPNRWIIVSDGSTDGTDEIVQRYAKEHPFIELLRLPERRERQFAAKAHAFNAAYALLKTGAYDVIGNLDADITFDPGYLEFLLGKFAENDKLGVAGTPFVEDFANARNHTYGHVFASLDHVSGACQLFRRECFEGIGGYVPIKGGAIDWIAVTTARMRGWQTRTFTDKVCFHHRKLGTGTGQNSKLEHALPLRQKSLLRWRPSCMGNPPRLLPNAATALSDWRISLYLRLHCGGREKDRTPGFRGANKISPGRTT